MERPRLRSFKPKQSKAPRIILCRTPGMYNGKITSTSNYSIKEILYWFIYKYPSIQYNELLEAHILLNINLKKNILDLNKTILLPHSFINTQKVAILCSEPNVKQALQNGAYVAGINNILDQIYCNKITFDILLTTTLYLPLLLKKNVNQLVSPSAKWFPNFKTNTLFSTDLELYTALKKYTGHSLILKKQKDKNIHFIFGSLRLFYVKLYENFIFSMQAINNLKPVDNIGNFIKKVSINCTMSPNLVCYVNY